MADVEKIEDPKQRLAIQASLPDWLVDELVAQYGLAQTEALAKVINEPARISLHGLTGPRPRSKKPKHC